MAVDLGPSQAARSLNSGRRFSCCAPALDRTRNGEWCFTSLPLRDTWPDSWMEMSGPSTWPPSGITAAGGLPSCLPITQGTYLHILSQCATTCSAQATTSRPPPLVITWHQDGGGQRQAAQRSRGTLPVRRGSMDSLAANSTHGGANSFCLSVGRMSTQPLALLSRLLGSLSLCSSSARNIQWPAYLLRPPTFASTL